MGETSTPEVWLSTSCDHSVDIQHAGIVSRAVRSASSGHVGLAMNCALSVDIQHAVTVNRAVICASSGEGSLLCG